MNDSMNMSGVPGATAPTGRGLPSHRQNAVLPKGLWSNEETLAALWADCLGGRTEGESFAARLTAMARLFRYGPERNPWMPVNVAWFNGATAAECEVPWSVVDKFVGGELATGRMLLEAVASVKGVAGSEGRATREQRELLRQAFTTSGLDRLPHEQQLEAAIAGGWLAFGAEHLVTHRALKTELTAQTDWLLCGQLVRAAMEMPEVRFDEALARVLVADYGPNKPLEAAAVGRAATESLRRSREEDWGLCGFLLDGVERGAEMVREEAGNMLAVLVELQERLTVQEEILTLLFDGQIGTASDETLWRKGVVQWVPHHLGKVLEDAERGTMLRVLRVLYDGQFWDGATREMNRHGTTDEWMDARIAHIAAQALEAASAEE